MYLVESDFCFILGPFKENKWKNYNRDNENEQLTVNALYDIVGIKIVSNSLYKEYNINTEQN